MNYILFDDYSRNNLLPLTFTRPVCDLQFGILSIREKWERVLNATTSTLTEDYLGEKFPIVRGNNNILINGSISPSDELLKLIGSLKANQALVSKDSIVALHVSGDDLEKIGEGDTEGIEEISIDIPLLKLNYPWDIVSGSQAAIEFDYELLTKGRKSMPIPPHVRAINPERIFIEQGAVVDNAILNASEGSIYIGPGARVMDGAMIRGTFGMAESSTVKMGAVVYGPTAIGAFAKIGGEVEHSILFAYSNKPHPGYLGHSVIGQWCNLASGTTVANLNNTYRTVRAWNYTQQKFIDTGLQFLGLIMGDHSKTGILTMFNTGTIVGVNSNVFGSGYQRNFVPSFVWGGTGGYTSYDIKKAIETASYVYKRREYDFDAIEHKLLTSVYEITFNNIRL